MLTEYMNKDIKLVLSKLDSMLSGNTNASRFYEPMYADVCCIEKACETTPGEVFRDRLMMVSSLVSNSDVYNKVAEVIDNVYSFQDMLTITKEYTKLRFYSPEMSSEDFYLMLNEGMQPSDETFKKLLYSQWRLIPPLT